MSSVRWSLPIPSTRIHAASLGALRNLQAPASPDLSIHFARPLINQRACRLRIRRWMDREVDNELRAEGWDIPD